MVHQRERAGRDFVGATRGAVKTWTVREGLTDCAACCKDRHDGAVDDHELVWRLLLIVIGQKRRNRDGENCETDWREAEFDVRLQKGESWQGEGTRKQWKERLERRSLGILTILEGRHEAVCRTELVQLNNDGDAGPEGGSTDRVCNAHARNPHYRGRGKLGE